MDVRAGFLFNWYRERSSRRRAVIRIVSCGSSLLGFSAIDQRDMSCHLLEWNLISDAIRQKRLRKRRRAFLSVRPKTRRSGKFERPAETKPGYHIIAASSEVRFLYTHPTADEITISPLVGKSKIAHLAIRQNVTDTEWHYVVVLFGSCTFGSHI